MSRARRGQKFGTVADRPTLHARRTLQGVDHVGRQAMLDALIRAGDGAVGEEIADHTLATLVNEERVAPDSIVIDRSVAG